MALSHLLGEGGGKDNSYLFVFVSNLIHYLKALSLVYAINSKTLKYTLHYIAIYKHWNPPLYSDIQALEPTII